MKVKLKDPSRVYYDKEQRLSFAGKGEIPTKATFHVRQLINQGALIEVSEVTAEQKKAILDEAAAEEKKKTPAQLAAAKKKAEADTKKVETA